MYCQTPNFKDILKLISFLSSPRYFRFCINHFFPREFLDFIRLPKLPTAQKNRRTMLYVNEPDRARSGVNVSVHMHVHVRSRAGVWECKRLVGYRGRYMGENGECLLSSPREISPFPLIAPVSPNLPKWGGRECFQHEWALNWIWNLCLVRMTCSKVLFIQFLLAENKFAFRILAALLRLAGEAFLS